MTFLERLRRAATDAAVVVVPAAAVALLAASTKSFWGDEILSVRFAQGTVAATVGQAAADYHPPLYFLLLKGWIALFGGAEAALRLFQGAQGALFLYLALLLFRGAWPLRRYHPCWILLAASSELWLFLPMLRYYLLAGIFVMAATLALLGISAGDDWRMTPLRRRLRIALLAAAYTGALYTDYPAGAGVLLAHLLFVTAFRRGLTGAVSAAAGVALTAFAPWGVVLGHQIGRLAATAQTADFNGSPVAVPLKFAYAAYAYLFGETVYPFEPAAVTAIVLFAAAGILLLAARIRARRPGGAPPRRSARGETALALVVVLTGLAVTAVITSTVAARTSFMYVPSRTLFALPFVYLIGAGLYETLGSRWARILFCIPPALLALTGDLHWATNRHFLMPVYASPWREVVHDLVREEGLVIADESLCYRYYSRGEGPRLSAPRTEAELQAALDSLGSRPLRVHLILVGRESTPSEVPPRIVAWLRLNAVPDSVKQYVPIDEAYRSFKAAYLHRDAYDAKITVVRYTIGR